MEERTPQPHWQGAWLGRCGGNRECTPGSESMAHRSTTKREKAGRILSCEVCNGRHAKGLGLSDGEESLGRRGAVYVAGGFWWFVTFVEEVLTGGVVATKFPLFHRLDSQFGPRTLSTLTARNYACHTLEHFETLWLKSFVSHILHHSDITRLI